MPNGSKTPERALTWTWVIRVAYIISVLAFLLPFTTVKSCSTKEVQDYTGVELVAEGGGAITILLVLALVLLGLSFVRRVRRPAVEGLFHAGRSFGAGFAFVLATAGIGLQHLFDGTTARIGQYTCSGCWALLFLLSLALARGAHMRMLAAIPEVGGYARKTALWLTVLLVGGVFAVLFANPNDEWGERLSGVLLVLLLGVPLAAVLYFAVMTARTRLPPEHAGLPRASAGGTLDIELE